MQVHHLVVLDSQVVSSALQMCNLYDSSGSVKQSYLEAAGLMCTSRRLPVYRHDACGFRPVHPPVHPPPTNMFWDGTNVTKSQVSSHDTNSKCCYAPGRKITNLHEVSCCDCLANVAVVVFGPEVCALHLNTHACADANLHNKSLQPSHRETSVTGCMRLQTLQLELQHPSCCTETVTKSARPKLQNARLGLLQMQRRNSDEAQKLKCSSMTSKDTQRHSPTVYAHCQQP